jgi:hypothetical protein
MVTKYRNAQSYNIIENGILALLGVPREREIALSDVYMEPFYSHFECKVLLAYRQGSNSSSVPLPKSTTLSVDDDDDDGKGAFGSISA